MNNRIRHKNIYKQNEMLFKKLEKDIRFSFSIKNTILFEQNFSLPKNLQKNKTKSKITIIDDDTLSSVQKVEKQDNICILNFASGTSPGGGYINGATAQEEDICRRSGLYPCLISQISKNFYTDNLESDYLYTDNILFSPNVLVFRDKDYNILSNDELFSVSVITSPFANLKQLKNKLANGDIDLAMDAWFDFNNTGNIIYKLDTFEKYIIKMMIRFSKILTVAHMRGIKTLVLGAWGCGAFGNNPNHVSKLMNFVLNTKPFNYMVENIIFAIPDDNENFKIFTENLIIG